MRVTHLHHRMPNSSINASLCHQGVNEKSDSSPIAHVAVVSKHGLWFAALFTPSRVLLGYLCVESGFRMLCAQPGVRGNLPQDDTSVESAVAERDRLAMRETVRIRGGRGGQLGFNAVGEGGTAFVAVEEGRHAPTRQEVRRGW
jgi:hypothetical protein